MTERIQIGQKKKIAFVCSGGATKAGAFHLGVALALQEQGFRFYGGIRPAKGVARAPEPMEISTYVGSSAGSIITSYLASGYSLDNISNSYLGRTPSQAELASYLPKVLPRLTYQKMFNIRKLINVDKITQLRQFRSAFSHFIEGNWDALIEFKWLKMTGFFSTSSIEKYMREEVLPSNHFQDFLPELFIVATQLNHSRKVVFGKNEFESPPHDLTCQYETHVPISDACAASTALPVIFSPYPIKNRDNQVIHYIDGEIRDTLSTHVAADAGADLILASHTHQPYHFQQSTGSLMDHGLSAIVVQSIYLLIEQKIKNHIFNQEAHRNAIHAVSNYCKTEGISDKQRMQICSLLETQLNHKQDVDVIYIHPKPTDAQLFFGEHFSFSPKKMVEIVKSGFKATIETLRKYHFADRLKRHAIGTSGN